MRVLARRTSPAFIHPLIWEKHMTRFGSPFQNGTLSSLILGIGLVLAMSYFYLASPVKKPVFLVLIILAILSTIGSYYRYQNLRRQSRNKFPNGAD